MLFRPIGGNRIPEIQKTNSMGVSNARVCSRNAWSRHSKLSDRWLTNAGANAKKSSSVPRKCNNDNARPSSAFLPVKVGPDFRKNGNIAWRIHNFEAQFTV
jgi:hypothetical protein